MESIRISGVLTLRRPDCHLFRCRWRAPDTNARTEGEAFRPGRGCASAVGGGRRVWSTGLSQSWGSGCDGRCQVPVVGGLETLAEAGAERAVVDRTADLEQPVGTTPGPAHLLRLVHPAVHQEVGCALGQRRADPQPGSCSRVEVRA